MTDLQVEVRDDAITVQAPASNQSVTYQREAGSAMLVALDELRHPDADRLAFLAEAWRAAYDEAKSLGWLEPSFNSVRV